MKGTKKRLGSNVTADSVLHADLKARTISIFGEISYSLHLAMIDCLNQFKGEENVTVFICSPGGNLTAGFAIYDLLSSNQYPFSFVTVATGEALSAGILIFQAGRRRKMFRHARLLLHRPRLIPEDDVSFDRGGLEREDEFLKDYEDQICRLISQKTGKTIKIVRADMMKSTWFNAEEAVRYGLADEII